MSLLFAPKPMLCLVYHTDNLVQTYVYSSLFHVSQNSYTSREQLSYWGRKDPKGVIKRLNHISQLTAYK